MAQYIVEINSQMYGPFENHETARRWALINADGDRYTIHSLYSVSLDELT